MSMTKDQVRSTEEALRLALEALEKLFGIPDKWTGEGEGDVAVWRLGGSYRAQQAITAIKAALLSRSDGEAKDEPVAWKYDVTYNQDGTVSVALPDGDELRIVLPNQQEPYCWTWDVWVSGGKWRAEYGWEKPTEKVVNLQPLYTSPPQRKPLTNEEITQAFNKAMAERPKDASNAETNRLFVRAIEAAHGIKEAS